MSLLSVERDLQFILLEQLNSPAVLPSSAQQQIDPSENHSKVNDHPLLESATTLYLLSIQRVKEKDLLQFAAVRRMLAMMKSYIEASRSLLYKINFFKDSFQNSFQELTSFLNLVFDQFCREKVEEIFLLSKKILGGSFLQTPSSETFQKIELIEQKKETDSLFYLMHPLAEEQNRKNFSIFCTLLKEFIERNKNHLTLNREITSLKKILDLTQESTQKIIQQTVQKNRDADLWTAPFWQMSGYLVFGWLLLEQALIALPQLEAIWKKENATVEETKFAICENNPEARFYEAKVKTARFYVWNLLPLAQGIAQGILSNDQSAMKIRF